MAKPIPEKSFHRHLIARLQDPVSRILDPGSWFPDTGSGKLWNPPSLILDPASRILDLGSRIRDPGSCIMDPGPWILDPASWILNTVHEHVFTNTVHEHLPNNAFTIVQVSPNLNSPVGQLNTERSVCSWACSKSWGTVLSLHPSTRSL